MSALPVSILGPSCLRGAGLQVRHHGRARLLAGAERQNGGRSSQSAPQTGDFEAKLATRQRPGSRPGRHHRGERAAHTWRVLGQPGLLAVNPSSTKRACARCLSASATAVLQCASSTRTSENSSSQKNGRASALATSRSTAPRATL